MNKTKQGVKVSILNRDFIVACRDEEREDLELSAAYLDKQMRVIQKSGKVVGIERCAIMAALNISHELLNMRRQASASTEFESRVEALQGKIDEVLAQERQLSI